MKFLRSFISRFSLSHFLPLPPLPIPHSHLPPPRAQNILLNRVYSFGEEISKSVDDM